MSGRGSFGIQKKPDRFGLDRGAKCGTQAVAGQQVDLPVQRISQEILQDDEIDQAELAAFRVLHEQVDVACLRCLAANGRAEEVEGAGAPGADVALVRLQGADDVRPLRWRMIDPTARPRHRVRDTATAPVYFMRRLRIGGERRAMNIAQLLRNAALAHPGQPAVCQGTGLVHDYRTLARRSAGLAAGLRQRLGLATGERVVVAMRNRPACFEVLFGIWHAGLIAVPVNARLHRAEIAFICDSAGARLCLADDALATELAGIARVADGTLRLLSVEGPEYAGLLLDDEAPPLERAPADPAWLFYTSGTTGRPKGATLTHRNLMAMTLAHLADIDQMRPGDTMLHAAPLSHGCGLWAIPNTAMAAANLLPEGASYEPAEIARLLPRYRNVSMYHAPTMVARLVNDPVATAGDFRNLRTLIYGGSHMYRADLERALELLGPRLVQIYGQGESPNTISMLSKEWHVERDHPRHEARLGSAGIARTGVEIRVVDPDDRPLPAGELGEVQARGDIVMAGYWGNPEATAATLKGGWLHTGDVGTLDADGLLTLKDRAKDMIISGGSNIYPREIEEVLLTHPAVLEASVVGRPHREWGEETVAFVVLRPGAGADAPALDAHCLDHIARYKRPRDYRFVPGLPKSGYNKVLKGELRQLLARDPEAS